MVSFPLLNLPQVPQDLIIQNFTPIQIFHFSLISKKSHQLAKHAKIHVNSFTWIFSLLKRSIRIGPEWTPGSQVVSTISPYGYLNNQIGVRWYQIDNVMIASRLWVDASTREQQVFCQLEKDRDVLYEVISSRLSEIMKVKAFSCEIVTSEIPPFILNVTRCFKRLEVSTPLSISHEHARFLLEDIKVDEFHLVSPVEEGFSITKPLKHRKLYINDGRWFTGENLMNMDCEGLVVHWASITQTDALEFFEKWKNGGFPRLRDLSLYSIWGMDWTVSVGQVDAQGRQILEDCHGNIGDLQVSPGSLVFMVDFLCELED